MLSKVSNSENTLSPAQLLNVLFNLYINHLFQVADQIENNNFLKLKTKVQSKCVSAAICSKKINGMQTMMKRNNF